MLVPESTLEVIVFHFVEAIHVELPYETIHLFMTKVTRKHYLFELHDISDYKL